MNKYNGVPCPICGKVFTKKDDVVVCPECGAPHHRDCYRELGHCALSEQHTQGFVWKNPNHENANSSFQPEATQTDEQAGNMFLCPRCNSANEAGSIFCRSCGMKLGISVPPPQTPDYQRNFQSQGDYQVNLNAQQTQSAAQFGIGPEDKINGVTVKEIAQFIGENTFYYLPRFKLFDMAKHSISVNFSAIIFNFFYYFNRKMYKAGTVLLSLFILSMLPNLLLVYYLFPDILQNLLILNAPPIDWTPYSNLLVVSNILHYIYLIVCLFSGFFANKLYFRFVLKRISDIKKDYDGRPESEYAQALAVSGRTNKVLVVAVAALLFICYFVYYALLLTTYNLF